jgi:hypothetical protein
MQLWVMHIDDKVIVIDLGVGNHKKRASERMNNAQYPDPAVVSCCGCGSKSVTHVDCHPLSSGPCGLGNTHGQMARWVPMFPNARHLMPKVDFENAHAAYLKGDKGCD